MTTCMRASKLDEEMRFRVQSKQLNFLKTRLVNVEKKFFQSKRIEARGNFGSNGA